MRTIFRVCICGISSSLKLKDSFLTLSKICIFLWALCYYLTISFELDFVISGIVVWLFHASDPK